MIRSMQVISRILKRFAEREKIPPNIATTITDIVIVRHYKGMDTYRDAIRLGKQLMASLHQLRG